MSHPESGFRPRLVFLSEAEKSQIEEASYRILEEVGMKILHDEALELLERAGCPPDEGGVVRIRRDLVRAAVAGAPRSIPVFDRKGWPAMDLGGTRSYFGTGSDLIYTLDPQTGERRMAVLEDVGTAARVCDALANIDFIMSFAHPSDVPPQHAYLRSFQAMAEHSVKPIVCTAERRSDLHEMWRIARILRGGEEALRARPYFIQYAEPISPLQHPHDSLDKLLYCAERGIPVIYSPAPIAGSTAPLTIAGHVAQGLAESFCGLVVHQLKAKGAPFIMGMGPAVLDMATGQCSYNAPEYYLSYAAMIEMIRHFDLPSWGYAGTSDSQIPDGQAAFEGGLLTFLSAFTGANLNHDVGYLDFGKTGSLDFVVMLDEFVDQVRRLRKGIPVDDAQLALEVLREVGHGGHFLSHPHTLEHLRSTQWRPKLLNRSGFERWEKAGSSTLLDRAHGRLLRILESHRPEPLEAEAAEAVDAVVAAYRPEA